MERVVATHPMLLEAKAARPALFFQQLFANPVSSFFGMDVIVSSVVLWVFVLTEGRLLGGTDAALDVALVHFSR